MYGSRLTQRRTVQAGRSESLGGWMRCGVALYIVSFVHGVLDLGKATGSKTPLPKMQATRGTVPN